MKKIYNLILLVVLILFGFIQNVNANTDQTSITKISYCENGEPILKLDFDLGGHHHYYRQYYIDRPGIIEVTDDKHITFRKALHLKIDGCGYQPETCNITQEGNWEYLQGEDKDKVILNISTSLSINKTGDNLIINGSGTTENVNINFENNYTSNGKNLELQLLDNKIQLLEYGYDSNGILTSQVVRKIEFNNRELDGKDEFYYEIDNDNKKIILKQRKFKKISTGVAASSENEYDIFSAFDGSNTGGGTCPNPKGQSNNGYCTGLNYWDYNQHHYTTTKVKLYREIVNCTKEEYSDGTKSIVTASFDSTVGNIKSPIFDGPLTINGVTEKDWGSTIYASDELIIKGLKYKVVGKVGGQKMGVKKIKASLKANDITLGEDIYTLSNKKYTTGSFGILDFIIKNDSGEVITNKSGNYQIVFTFFDENGQQLGTYETPLTIIPNNNFKLGWHTADKTTVYASNKSADSIRYCKQITDEFGNEINKEYNVFSNVTILDGIKDANNTEALQITNIEFKNSKFCFNINSLVPEKKILKFKIKVPKHKQLESLDSNGQYKEFTIQTPKLEFKQPLSIELKGAEMPQLGKKQSFEIKLNNIGNIDFTSGKLFLDKNSFSLVSGHYLQQLTILDDNVSNSDLAASFNGIIDANNNVLKLPTIQTKDLYIKYNIGGKIVKYKLEDSNILKGDNTCNLDTLGVKVVGNLQGDGKSELTGQKANISDLSKSNLRKDIRKNAYKNISGRSSSKTSNINGIIYVEGDVKYSEIKNYINIGDTLIIKDGNFIIDTDINKFIGVIVLKDNYNVLADYDNSGNIYVNNNVENIDAVIYADGTFRSADENGNSYNDSELGTQLKFNGSLFTRNTIGGAVLGNTDFTLPGGKITTDYNLASIYDLNYIRKVSPECDAIGNQKEDSISFIIKYNSQIQTNSPKLFGK